MTDSSSIAAGEPAEILLAEDQPTDADLCMRVLKRKNVASRIVWVKDGAEALDFLFARGAYASRTVTDRPRLLLLDIKMPLVDGFEVLRQVRADERLATMPVVILTSSTEERDIAHAYHLGANSYVAKPVDFASFQQAVARRRHVLVGPQQGPRDDSGAMTASPAEAYQALFETPRRRVLPPRRTAASSPPTPRPASCSATPRRNSAPWAARESPTRPTAEHAAALVAERAATGQLRGVMSWRRRDGTTFPGEFSSMIFTDASGHQRTCVILRDMSSGEQMEQRLAGQLRQAQAANDELTSFTSYVSHDLRAPLRALNGYSQALAVLYGDRLDDTARDLMDRIREASREMDTLLDDLLQWSRLGRAELHRAAADLSALARESACSAPGRRPGPPRHVPHHRRHHRLSRPRPHPHRPG